MDSNDIDVILRKWRKKSLLQLVAKSEDWEEVDFQSAELECLLPHRSPFLLVDSIRRVSLTASLPGQGGKGLLVGERYLDPADPVFAGHFPDFPVYPGVLQLEMLGQLALCLSYFGSNGVDKPCGKQELNIRASRVLGAYYLAPVLPSQKLQLVACELGESDDFFGRMLGQVLVNNEVAMVCAQEVCFIS